MELCEDFYVPLEPNSYILISATNAQADVVWGVSSDWLERRPVTSEVAGSIPVLPAIAIKASS